MLSKFGQEIADCRRRAADCGESATAATNQQTKRMFLDLEQRWLSLAESLEFTLRMGALYPSNADKI